MFNTRFLIWLGFVITPFLIMIGVNEIYEKPSIKMEVKCSRFCHNNSCPHFSKLLKESPSSWRKIIKKTFDWNVGALHKNSLGWSYQNINLLLYVLGLPGLMAILLWGAIRKPK